MAYAVELWVIVYFRVSSVNTKDMVTRSYVYYYIHSAFTLTLFNV